MLNETAIVEHWKGNGRSYAFQFVISPGQPESQDQPNL